MKVLCTSAIDDDAKTRLSRVARVSVLPEFSTEALRDALADTAFLVVRNALPEDIFDSAPALRGVVRHGTGLDMIPVAQATALGIPVANVPGANAQAVIEYYVAGLLATARPLHAMSRRLSTDGWGDARQLTGQATQLHGKTLGIIGVGTIGGGLAQSCRLGFGMNVLGYQGADAPLPEGVRAASLAELLSHSDYVALCCPLTEQTRGLLDAQTLGLMKPSAVLLNAARGPVVVEEALISALRSGRLRAAVLDVFDQQPLERSHPYFSMDNVFLTPHVAGLSTESFAEMSRRTVDQLLQMMAGEAPTHLVNPSAWPGRCVQGGAQ